MTPHYRWLAPLLLPLVLGASSPGTISTYAGGGPNNVPALQANVPYPVNTAVDSAGNFYIVSGWRIFKVNASGTLTVLAGTGFAGYAGDGGPATQAELNGPAAAAVDSSGNVYIADEGNCIVRKVTASTGVISTVAGRPSACGYAGDGGAADSAELAYPAGVAVDGLGNVYIADVGNCIVRKVTASTGVISTVAGKLSACGYAGDGGAAASAELSSPAGVALDGLGNVYIADQANYRIRKVTVSTGVISTIAGNGKSGFSGDGGAGTSAEISYTDGIASDSSGNVFFANGDRCVVREVNTHGTINTVAGNYSLGCAFSGDGGAATGAQLGSPRGVAVDSADNLYIADTDGDRIRKAALGGDIHTVAGNGSFFSTAGVTPTDLFLDYPGGLTSDASGNIYFADDFVVRKVTVSSGDLSIIATTGARKMVADSSGNVYMDGGCAISKVTASTGDISTVAGMHSCGYGGDSGPATSAQLSFPLSVALDGSGNLYIADTGNNVIREVIAATGIITTIAGNHAGGVIWRPAGAGYSGDGGPATSALLNFPYDLALDAFGSLYIADTDNNCVRVVNPSGIITTFAGNGVAGYGGDGIPANETSLYLPGGVAVDGAGDVLIADSDNNRIRWVDGQGIIYTVAGDGTYGFLGDGGLATSAALSLPMAVSVDPAGNIYISDSANLRIRKVNAIANLNASAYYLSFSKQPVNSISNLRKIKLTSVGEVQIKGITITGDFTQTNDCPGSLTAGSNCNVDITFTPSAAGTRTGKLLIRTNGYFNPTIAVQLKGNPPYAPSALNFGERVVGIPSKALTVTFTNDSAAVTFSSVTTTEPLFTVVSNTCTGLLAFGQTCAIGVTFKPAASGLATASLVFKSSNKSSPHLIPLSGTGVHPQ